MPYHVLGSSILPGTELILTVPARLVSQFADSSRVRVLDAPRELGDVQFHAVWHPRLDEDPSDRWLRQVVNTVATPPPAHRRRAKISG
jgi:DNA-binding transcriptional LysR family regulator